MSREYELEQENEELRSKIEHLKSNFQALGTGWRLDWSHFDGRQLRSQINSILDGGNTGLVFLHFRNRNAGWHCDEGCFLCKEDEEEE